MGFPVVHSISIGDVQLFWLTGLAIELPWETSLP